jgi:predicted N-acyltransferase
MRPYIKIQRAYLPKPTDSAHYIAHPGLHRAVAEFLKAERLEKLQHMADLSEYLRFRREGEEE